MKCRLYAVRIRLADGSNVTRHYEASRPENAGRMGSGIGKVFGVRKVQRHEVLGNIERLPLDLPTVNIKQKGSDVVTENMTLADLFSSNKPKNNRRGLKPDNGRTE